MDARELTTHSAEETVAFGRTLAELLSPPKIVLLRGDLGAGKTTLVKGIAEGFQAASEEDVTSPTFTLVHEYRGPRANLYHIDLYRVGKQAEIDSLNLREYLYGDGVSLIEWFEFLPAHEVDEYLELRITHGGGNRRELKFVAHGARYEVLVQALRSKWKV